MANVDWPCGLRPVGNGKGGTAPRLRPYPKIAGTVFEGDILYMAEGGVAAADGTTDAQAQNIIGVAANYAATAVDTGDAVYVYDDPDQEFVAQLDDHSISTVANMNHALGRYSEITGGGTGNATTLQSKVELDGSSITSIWLVDFLCQIVRPWNAEDNFLSDNTTLGTNLSVVVKIVDRCHVFSAFSITRTT